MLQHGKRPTITSQHGMVAAAHPLAAAAGARILANGGNAFDAAAATTAALNVVEPYMSGLAGQGMATCYVAAEKRVRSLDGVANVRTTLSGGVAMLVVTVHRGDDIAMREELIGLGYHRRW